MKKILIIAVTVVAWATVAQAHDGVVVGQDGKAAGTLRAEVLADVVADVVVQRIRREAELVAVDAIAVPGIDAWRGALGEGRRKVVPPDAPVAVQAVEVKLFVVASRRLGKVYLAVFEGRGICLLSGKAAGVQQQGPEHQESIHEEVLCHY